MKKILIPIVIYFFLLACFISCKKDNTQEDPNVVRLYNCSEKNIKTEPYICFDSLIEDSRCPADVICIWGGYARIKVSFHENNETHVFKIGLPSDTTINGYKISFEDLQPYPLVNRPPVTPDEITATIKITH